MFCGVTYCTPFRLLPGARFVRSSRALNIPPTITSSPTIAPSSPHISMRAPLSAMRLNSRAFKSTQSVKIFSPIYTRKHRNYSTSYKSHHIPKDTMSQKVTVFKEYYIQLSFQMISNNTPHLLEKICLSCTHLSEKFALPTQQFKQHLSL